MGFTSQQKHYGIARKTLERAFPIPSTAETRRSRILAAKRQAEKSTGEVPPTAESPHQENPHLLNCTHTHTHTR